MLLNLVVFIAFALVWYLPLYLRHHKLVHEPRWTYLKAFGLGLVSIIISALIQMSEELLTQNLSFSVVTAEIIGFLNVLFIVAATEELSKFFMGYLVLRKIPDLTEAGSMLVMGMVGLTFEAFEMIMTEDVFAAIVRGLTALHIFFQLWMGKYWWRAMQSKKTGDMQAYKKDIRLAILIPIVLHAAFDYPVLKANEFVDKGYINEDLGVIIIFAAILLAFASMIMIMISARRTLKEEKLQKALEANTEVTAEDEHDTEPESAMEENGTCLPEDGRRGTL